MKKRIKGVTAWVVLVAFLAATMLPPGAAWSQEDQPAETGSVQMKEEQPREQVEELTKKERRRLRKAEKLIEKGESSYQAKSFFWARKRLEKALKLDPSLYRAHKMLGEIHLEKGRDAEAYNQFVKYMSAVPEDVDVMLKAGVLAVRLGKNQRARIYLENGLDKRPENIEAKMALARLNYSEGYYDTARKQLEQVIAASPGMGEAHLILAKILLEQGEVEKAEDHLQRAAELMPENMEANVLLANSAYERAAFEKAIPPLETVTRMKGAGAEHHYLLAICYLATANEDKALEQFEKTIDKDPEYKQAAYQAGLLWKQKGDKRMAIKRLAAFAEKNPEHFDARHQLGALYIEQGELEKAEEPLEQAAKLQPNNPEVLYRLGKLSYDMQEYEKAYPYLRRALSLSPENTEIRYLLSATYTHLPNFPAAERELEWIIKKEDSQEAREKLARIRQQKEDLGKEPITGEEAPPEKTIAVVELRNAGSEPGWAWLGTGISEIMVQDLSMITSLQVVDPAALSKFMREQSLAPGSASPAIKRLGAEVILTGSYTVRDGRAKIDARLVDVETTRVIAAASQTGSPGDVFAMEREVLVELIPEYVPVTAAEKKALLDQPVLGLSSLRDLAKGKELYYMGKGEQAKKHLQKVVDQNPEYTPAAADLSLIDDAVSSAETLAVMPFKNATGNPEYRWMGMGIAESLTTDLKKITGIYLVERAEIDKALEEMKLGMLGFLDQETAPKVGQLVGAGVILVGSYQVSNKKLRIDARMVDVETGSVLLTEKIQGYENEIFKLEEQLAMKIADALNVGLTAEEMAALKEKPNIEKFKSYIISQASFRVGEAGEAGAEEEVINTVAVSRFRNLSGKSKYDFLEEAIPGYLVTELKSRAGMNMIERDQMERVMEEMQMAKTSYLDENKAPQVGQLVGADAVLVGFFQVQKDTIRADSRVIKTSTGEVLKTVSASGDVNDIFKIEEKLVTEIMSVLGVSGGGMEGAGAGLAKETGLGGRKAPVMASVYSFFLPGSSQYYISDKKTKGSIMLIADLALILGAAGFSMMSQQSFNDYSTTGEVDSYNEGADQIAMRNMLVYSILGLGTYSAVDAYIEANKKQKRAPREEIIAESPEQTGK